LYPVMVGAAGSTQTAKVNTTSDTLEFDASTGQLSINVLLSSGGFFNPNTINNNVTIAANTNGALVGPVTISDGVSFTLPDTSNFKLI